MADVKWIKMSTGLPDNKKLKQIRKLPDGDTIALMWVFMMCLAGEVNENGLIYITPEVPYTDEMLAEEFRIDINTIRLGLNTFERFGMIEIVEDVICLSAWEKWQSVDKLSEIREQTRKRVAKHREKQKLLAGNATSNVTVTHCNAIDIEEELEEEPDKEERKYIISEIVSYLNKVCGTNYRPNTKSTVKHINARLDDKYTLENFKTVIDKKANEWKGTDMEQYLCPDTLFGTKFEKYLNQQITKGGKVDAGNRTNAKGYDASDYYGNMQSDFSGF